MKIDLSGKTAIVTGSTSGIGLAIAKGLAATGANVIVNGRSQDNVDRAIEAVRAEPSAGTISGFAADLGTAKGCDDLVAAFPRCDILVNNLGIYGRQDFFETDDARWMQYFETNVLSGVRLARAYLPGMVGAGWGRAVFISSESGLSIPSDQIHYGCTKTAQLSIARGLAKRMAGTGVTVNSVLPGPTLSDGVAKMLEAEMAGTDKTFEEVAVEYVTTHRPASIIRRPASVEEVASMVVYACSTQASATTGAALRVEDGLVDCI
ncbi:SDR family NAD(P)-dependent oxidoreductase [Pelagibacterium lacus]|uniref:SDR family NAD(P)-dependent oxidoreductase n=1 Tax=Pelagibacterium lacus TaxID=2282655 RepID=A0A369W027_9HYPH|nr:SDR family oxidoreductase [Pelagibacterium lacus]RDE07733.1 SDR family NAD(P)-dependent oxidoreductase [Pelagibacterium lacus]